MNYFVTAIDTDSGKTLVSAILCKMLGYDYWKPIQAGLPKDSDTIKTLVPHVVIHPETYFLKTAASPHAAAKIDGIQIEMHNFTLPPSSNGIIIEGAGGCLVPLNQHDFVIDLAPQLDAEIILVADLYLGSINHTLLTTHFLKTRQYRVKGIIFNGIGNPESEQIILHHSGYRWLGHIHQEESISSETLKRYASQLKTLWNE